MRLRLCLAPALVLSLAAAVSSAQADVGVGIQFSEPGVYGRIDIGRYPQPQVILSAPVIAEPPPVAPRAPEAPIYLWVPPEHQAHWRQYCHQYHACGRPVYFVHHDWYREHVLAQHHPEERHFEERRGHEREERGERGRD